LNWPRTCSRTRVLESRGRALPGLVPHYDAAHRDGSNAKGLDTTLEKREETLKSLESVKHYLWHGNVARARDRIQDIHCFLDNEELTGENSRKLRKALDEFDTYVVVNEALIPNYGER
jgi:hypothetical protein